MKKLFRFGSDGVAWLEGVLGGCATLAVKSDTLPLALADKIEECKDIKVHDVYKGMRKNFCYLSLECTSSNSDMLEVVADAISCVYDADVVIRDERANGAV